MNTTSTAQHKISETLAYHLLPGIVILAGYIVFSRFSSPAHGLDEKMGSLG